MYITLSCKHVQYLALMINLIYARKNKFAIFKQKLKNNITDFTFMFNHDYLQTLNIIVNIPIIKLTGSATFLS